MTTHLGLRINGFKMRAFDFPFLSRDEAVDRILQILLRARNGSWSVTGFDRVSGLPELKSTRGFPFMKSTKCVKLRFTGGARTESELEYTNKGKALSVQSSLACPPKPGPVLMGIVQLAESQGAIHAKTTQTGPDRGYPPRLPSRSRLRLEHQPCLPQGRDRTYHLLRWKALQEDPVSNEQLRIAELESEVGRLKLLDAELALDRRMLQEALKKKP